MNTEELQRQLLEAFAEEACERIENLFSRLTELEKTDDADRSEKIVEIIYREAHSLKGAARSVNIPAIESLCQVMETLFSELKQQKSGFTPALFDILHESTALIETYIAADESGRNQLNPQFEKAAQTLIAIQSAIAGGDSPKMPADVARISNPGDLRSKTRGTTSSPAQVQFNDDPEPEDDHNWTTPPLPSGPSTPSPCATGPKPLFSETVRISTAKLDSLLLKTEELISIKQILNQHLFRMHRVDDILRHWRKQYKRIMPELKSQARNKNAGTNGFAGKRITGFIESGQAHLQNVYEQINALSASLELDTRTIGALVDDLLDEMKKTSLLPFSTLFALIPRMVREIARQRGKEVEVELAGGDIEVDKRILEGLKDPLIHLLRNAVDHGIELPVIREKSRKKSWGRIRVIARQPESSRVEIELSDDGCGIDIGAIKARAVKAGIMTAENAKNIPEDEALALIFHSGISTSPIIDEISGRGLGMAIVQDVIERLGGTLRVNNEPGRGSAFIVDLPVTLTTYRGILVLTRGHFFIIPNAFVNHTLNIDPANIKTAENRSVLSFNGRALSLVDLGDVLKIPAAEKTPASFSRHSGGLPAILISSADKEMAVIVDRIIQEQAILVKSLGKQLRRVTNISGATILGSGRVVPIINVNDLIKSATESAVPAAVIDVHSQPDYASSRSVLVVEDSFTSRTLLKNILEASGFLVQTSIDGADGLQCLKSGTYDAVVSDVEMPNMNGFELTEAIRKDKSLSHLPVILVTSLDSRSDRERGVDAGADAYIVKNNFDKSNLLEVLNRLI